MFRRLIATVALVASVAPYALAEERANFILTTGERKSGRVVFHGDAHENLINGFLNLGTDDNSKELTFPIAQVAVIDFAGGRPANAELAQLGSGHMLVMRDGSTQQGRFVNMTGGDTLLWENQSGQAQRFAIRDVSRVYLNAESAKTVFNYTAPSGVNTATAGTAGVAVPGAVLVQANQAWTDTGITVPRGARVTFQSSGTIHYGQGADQTATLDGNPTEHRATYPLPSAPVGALIGKVGNGPVFGIGSSNQPLSIGTGRLMLGINDDQLGDNSGFYSVVVTVVGGGRVRD